MCPMGSCCEKKRLETWKSTRICNEHFVLGNHQLATTQLSTQTFSSYLLWIWKPLSLKNVELILKIVGCFKEWEVCVEEAGASFEERGDCFAEISCNSTCDESCDSSNQDAELDWVTETSFEEHYDEDFDYDDEDFDETEENTQEQSDVLMVDSSSQCSSLSSGEVDSL